MGEQTKQQTSKIKETAAAIVRAKEDVTKGRLFLQSRYKIVDQLCAYGQPRLKKVFLETEVELMTFQMGTIIGLVNVTKQALKDLAEKKLMREPDQEKVESRIKEMESTLEKSAKALGYASADGLWIRNLKKYAPGVGLAGAGGCITAASVTSANAVAAATAAGETAAVFASAASAGTGFGLIIIGTMVIRGHGIWRLCKGLGDDKSEEIARSLIEQMEAITDMNSACKDHIISLNAMLSTLDAAHVLEERQRL